MSPSILVALLGFAFATTVTPGPNNLMLMASGANFGFRKTMPHIIGIVIGLSVLTLFTGIGLGALFEAYPYLKTILEAISIAYLLWLAWKIATAAPMTEASSAGKPMTFMQAVAFQWFNPKAWAMGLSAIAIYAPDRSISSIAIVTTAFALVCFPAISIWAWLGTVFRKWLSSTFRRRTFNLAMAALLIFSLYPIVGSI